MDPVTKKRTSNLLFFLGLPVVIVGLLLTAVAPVLGLPLFILGALATVAGIVVGFLPVRS